MVEHPLGKGKVLDSNSSPSSEEMTGYVYILQSEKNKRYYVGSTNDLERRIKEHQQGRSKYTSNNLPVKLVFSQQYSDLTLARNIEYKIKNYKSKVIIEKIINSGRIEIS